MNIKTSNINAYFINPDDYKRRLEGITSTLNQCNFKSITRIAFNEKFRGKNITMTQAHLAALKKAEDDNAFPFILFEDDARLMKPFPEEFDIPVEAELIYLGGSTYNYGVPLKLEKYNSNFYRIYNMVSAHAILIPNITGLLTIREAYSKAVEKSSYNDILLAESSNSHIFLVPIEGNYFYQDDYTSSVTKFLWEDIKNKFIKHA